MINQTFGRWTVIEDMGRNDEGRQIFKCRCVCGLESILLKKRLTSGQSKGCKNKCQRKLPVEALFLKHVRPHENGSCWKWIGSTSKWGYGKMRLGNKTILSHRLSWILHNDEELPSDLLVLHSCDVPCCVNPNHLFLGTHQDNMTDMIKKGRYVSGVKGKTWKVKRKSNV